MRTELEPAISTTNCPRLYGTFADETSCSVFWKCLDGRANRYECPPGLAYDQFDHGCKWADQVPECKNVVVAVEGEQEEFKCPARGAVGAFTKHAHPADCRQYFVCIGGVPREYGCPLGTVFSIGADEFSGKCTDPAEVAECKDYYGDLEFNSVDLSKAGADTGPLPERVRSGSAGIVRNSIVREPVKQEVRAQPEETKRRPAPAALQAIVDDRKFESPAESVEPAKPQFRPRPRPSRPVRPVVEEVVEEEVEEVATEPSRPSRLQVLTDKPRTPFPRRQETTLSATTRPFTAVFASEETVQTTTRAPTTLAFAPETIAPEAVVVAAAGGSDGLPDPIPASPGPNGEEYYYYYYYDEEEGEEVKQN